MLEQERFIDLVHRELDGELTENEREFLQRLLAADSGRRDFRERLQRLHRTLEDVPDVAPPSALRGKVLGALPSPRQRQAALGGRDVTARKRTVPHRGLPRLAYPLAAGFLGLAVLAVWWLGTGPDGPGLEPGTASGTMGLRLDGGQLLDEAGASLDDLTARAGLYRVGRDYTVLLEIDTPGQVEVTVACAPSDCAVKEFSWLQGGTGEAGFAGDRLTARVTGRAGLTASFSDTGRRWTVEFKAADGNLGRLSLAADPGAGD